VLRLTLDSPATRRLAFGACCFLVDDLLVDAGFSLACGALLDGLRGHPIEAIALTHHHEDHSGNAGTVAAERGCPIYLRAPEQRFTEGLARLPAYRRFHWGVPAPYEALAMPAELRTAQRRLRCLPSPGHSATHSLLFDEVEGLLFSGDLFISRGASALMSHEDPMAIAGSLRLAAALEPRLMLTGHGLRLEQPTPALLHKAEAIEDAARQVIELHERGRTVRHIRDRVFPRGAAADLGHRLLTRGEFCRANFVRAVLRAQRAGDRTGRRQAAASYRSEGQQALSEAGSAQ